MAGVVQRGRGGEAMSSVRTFHSPRQKVHHRDRGCGAGQIIAPEELRAGTGGRDLCPECAELVRAKNGGLFEPALVEVQQAAT
jgi:hypothetical protein